MRMLEVAQGLLVEILKDGDCTHLFFFGVLVAVVAGVELLYGTWTGSLGLLSIAFHTIMDCITVFISLFAMILAKHRPTAKYSYGYDRYEVLSSFSNGVFLLFVCLFLVYEAIERLLEPIPIHQGDTEKVMLVAVVGLAVNVIGILFFHQYTKPRAEVKHAREENLISISVHVLLDAVGSIGVLFSTWLMGRGWLLADPIMAIAISCLIVYNAYPICKRTGRILLQTTPLSTKDQLDKALREASTVEGVLECRNEHFWTQSPGVFVGSLYIRVRSDTNEQQVLARTRSLFAPIIQHLTIQVEKDDWQIPIPQQ